MAGTARRARRRPRAAIGTGNAEVRNLLLDACARILDAHPHVAHARPMGGSISQSLWGELVDAGFAQIFAASATDEGPSLADALVVISRVSGCAHDVPLAETLFARYLLGRSGLPAEDEIYTVIVPRSGDSLSVEHDSNGWRVKGTAHRVPWARHCRLAVIVAESNGRNVAVIVRIEPEMITHHVNLAEEPRDDLNFACAVLASSEDVPLTPDDVWALGTLLRCAQMLGSMARILDLTLDYSTIRHQFGRRLAQFQAVKQLIARMGEERAAASAAFDCAVSIIGSVPGSLAIPFAKIRIGEAASALAAIAHQIFGAVGYTRDHELQVHSKRIWSWRDEFGSESHWSATVGRQLCAAGSDNLWPLLVASGRKQASELGDFVEQGLRSEVRRFIRDRDTGRARDGKTASAFDPQFSREMGQRGWIGSSWPPRYGGRDGNPLTRFVVLEEMLAMDAPVLAHMVGERQSGPLLMRYGTETQRMSFLPRIAAGECYFCIGMSEPDAGSDLAALRTHATKVDGGFRVSGTKIWTSLAHLSDYIIVLCRTSPRAADRHAGMSQFIIDLRSDGISIQPILNLAGEHEFNQLFFDDVFVPEGGLIGTLGEGWKQALSELVNERGGSDRFLSNFSLLRDALDEFGVGPSDVEAMTVGRICAHLSTLRELARSVVEPADGDDVSLTAMLVKDLGAAFEQELVRSLRERLPLRDGIDCRMGKAVIHSPSYSIRGGSHEILLGVIADRLIASK